MNAVTSALESAQSQRGTAITALVLGLALSLNGASGAFGAVGRALNVVWRVEEGRGFVAQQGQRPAVDARRPRARDRHVRAPLPRRRARRPTCSAWLGLGDTAADVWRIVRWPLALPSAMLVYAVVYYAAPNVEVRRFQWITPGAVFGVLTWIVASALFFLYVSNFSSYSATYGAFAAAVILLVWLWLTNVVLLFGAELNAVIDLRRSPELSPATTGPPLPAKVPADS